MRLLVEYAIEGGGSIVVEVDEPGAATGVEHAARLAEIPERAEQTFQEALARVKPAAIVALATVRELADPPDELAIEFGVKLTAKAGAVIAAAGADANFTLTMTWRRNVPGQAR